MAFLWTLAGLFVLAIIWLIVFKLFYSSCNKEDEHRMISANTCTVFNALALALAIGIPFTALIAYCSEDSSTSAEYIAKLENVSTFRGQMDCEDDVLRFKGTQVLEYEHGHKTYSTKYPVQIEHRVPVVCEISLKPPVRVIKQALRNDQAVIKKAIFAELTKGEYPEEINERQRAVAKRVAEVLTPIPSSTVQLEVSSDLASVKSDSPLVKVPVSAAPAPSPQDLGIGESLSRQVSGQ